VTGENPQCRVCGSSRTEPFLVRKESPVHQNLLCRDQQAAVEIDRGDIKMVVCSNCGFVFNSCFDDSKLVYGQDYDNSQLHSPGFKAYVEELTQYLVEEAKVRNRRIVEIGCGKGDFLRRVVRDEKTGNVGYGFDPSYTGAPIEFGGRLRFEPRYFDQRCADIRADVVICRHVIEHIAQPLELLETIRNVLGDRRDGQMFLETPCVEWILNNRVMWDFFYEHCSLFSAASLVTALQKTGFDVVKVRHVFGGQYLWIEGRPLRSGSKIGRNPGDLPVLARQYGAAEERIITTWKSTVQSLLRAGKVAVWGAGAKGTTFVNLIDPNRTWLDCVVDLNPNKQGHFIAGSGHPIVSYQELMPRGVATAILMNPNYGDENRLLLRDAGIQIDLIEPQAALDLL
jgi:SAM-dependent methyltransferase